MVELIRALADLPVKDDTGRLCGVGLGYAQVVEVLDELCASGAIPARLVMQRATITDLLGPAELPERREGDEVPLVVEERHEGGDNGTKTHLCKQHRTGGRHPRARNRTSNSLRRLPARRRCTTTALHRTSTREPTRSTTTAQQSTQTPGATRRQAPHMDQLQQTATQYLLHMRPDRPHGSRLQGARTELQMGPHSHGNVEQDNPEDQRDRSHTR